MVGSDGVYPDEPAREPETRVVQQGSVRVPAPDMTDDLAGSDGPAVLGRVTGPEDTVVAGAHLTLTDLSGRQLTRTRSSQDGRYRLLPPSGGAYLLICASGDLTPTASLVNIGQGATRHDVVLAAATQLAGSVLSVSAGAVDRRGLREAFVTLTDVRGQVVGSAMTGPDGSYLLDDLVGGDHVLTTTADGHQPHTQTVHLPDSGTLSVDVQLVRSGELAGVVRVAGTGQPLPGAVVTVVDAGGSVVAHGLTDDDGRYAFDDLLPGGYTVTSSGYAPVAAHAEVAGGGVSTQDLSLGQDVAARA